MLATLQRFCGKDTHRVIGLMSGTSVDGIDAAVCELSGHGRGDLKIRILGTHAQAFDAGLRARILEACRPDGGSSRELCELNFMLGEELAHAAKNAVQAASLSMSEIDLVGSHGQTVAHYPPGSGNSGSGVQRGSTLQIGCAAVIAERTGLPVVSNFRPRDMAAGGQGAPLVPFADWLLFSSASVNRAALNIGGIANVTWLPAGTNPDAVEAFDIGPGNMVLDALAAEFSGGKLACDRDGTLAAAGRVDEAFLQELLAHPYFERKPPKSAGREEFGAAYSRALLLNGIARKLAPSDIMATAAALTARSIARELNALAARSPAGTPELFVAGGGVLNPVLMALLKNALPGWRVDSTQRLGVPPQWRECAAFAILARETLLGRSSNLPGATGARGGRVLGEITPGTAEGVKG